MDFQATKLPDFSKMLLGAITFMDVERKIRILFVVSHHHRITGHFSQYGCGADGFDFSVSFYNRLCWDREFWKPVTIDQNLVGQLNPLIDRCMANSVACKIFSSSISLTSASAIE